MKLIYQNMNRFKKATVTKPCKSSENNVFIFAFSSVKALRIKEITGYKLDFKLLREFSGTKKVSLLICAKTVHKNER